MPYSTTDTDRQIDDLWQLVGILSGKASQAAIGIPLSRFKFVSGDSTVATQDGAIGAPYKTISAGLAALAASASVADATALQVIQITPAVAGYTEPLAFPAYRCVELVAGNFPQNTITGTITIHNVANAGTHVPPVAQYILHNLQILGNLAFTDDGLVPSELFISCDELFSALSFQGSITATGASALAAIVIDGCTVTGGINCGTGVNQAAVSIANGASSTNVVAKSISAVASSFGGNLTVGGLATTVPATFSLCSFANAPVLTGPAGTFAQFDGVSWRNFLAAGGTVAAAGINVVVTGGYTAAPVQGVAIGDVGAVLSENGTGAGATWAAGGNFYIQNTAITANRIIQVAIGGGEKTGDIIRVVRSVTDANGFHLTFEDDTGATIATLPGANRGCVDFEFNGTHWVFGGGGGGLT